MLLTITTNIKISPWIIFVQMDLDSRSGILLLGILFGDWHSFHLLRPFSGWRFIESITNQCDKQRPNFQFPNDRSGEHIITSHPPWWRTWCGLTRYQAKSPNQIYRSTTGKRPKRPGLNDLHLIIHRMNGEFGAVPCSYFPKYSHHR